MRLAKKCLLAIVALGISTLDTMAHPGLVGHQHGETSGLLVTGILGVIAILAGYKLKVKNSTPR